MGYYDIYFDLKSQTFNVVENRTAGFTLNIVPFLNLMTIPMNGITFDSIVIHDDDPSFLGVDVEFSIYHPFPGIPQYNAYDLLGVVIGDSSRTLSYDNLKVAKHGLDLWMKNPDGYTRWFNPTEFASETIFGYVPGGWQNYAGSATVNPYKYYSKHLGKDDNLWSYLTGDNNWDGIFESGSGRTMELEFPLPPDGIGLQFGYAVIVAWEDQGPDGPFYPVHLAEAITASVNQTPDAWYNETDGSGGDLILDIDLFGWEFQPDSIKVESTILDGIESFDFATNATPGGEHFSTWHVETPADSFTGTEDHDAWIICEYEDFDYKNNAPQLPSPDSPLAAFFRTDIVILDEAGNTAPSVTGIEDVEGSGEYENPVNINNSKTYWAIFTDPDPDQTHTFTWYIVDDGDGPPDPADEVAWPVNWGGYGQGEYDIYVDVSDGITTTQGGPYDITVNLVGSVITFGGPSSEYMQDFALDSEGGMYSCGYFFGTINLDPEGNDPHSQVGGGNMWVNKINADGTFAWGYSWPSLSGYHSYVWAVEIDDQDDIYFVGSFHGTTDFNPDDTGVDMHTASNGGNNSDAFLMKFNSDGEYLWGLNWGGTPTFNARDVKLYDNSYLYITGYFTGTCDLDPTGGVDNHTGNGSGNATNGYLIKIDTDGTMYYWGYDWGDGGVIYSYHIGLDNDGNAAVTGTVEYTADLDPGPGVQNYTAYYTSSAPGDSFLTKFAADGTWQWAFGFGDIAWDLSNGVACDSSGNIYVIGGFSSPSCDFDPDPDDEAILYRMGNPDEIYMYDGFLAKYDPSGDFVWVKQFATVEHDNIWVIMFDDADNMIVAGHTRGTMDLDPGGGVDEYASHGENDAWVVKFDSSDNYLWGSGWGGPSWDYPSAGDIHSDGLIYIVGVFSVTVDFDPGDDGVFEKTSNGSYDEFINRLIPNTGEW